MHHDPDIAVVSFLYLNKMVASAQREDALPLQEDLNRIRENYDKLKASEALTPKETANLTRMLDENSDRIFRLRQRVKNRSHKI